MNWDIITYSLVALTLTAAAVALILAKLEVRDKRNKFFGFRPRDLKTYAAYISFVSTILIIFFQTRKEIKANSDLLERYRFEDFRETTHFDSSLQVITSTLLLQQETIHKTDSILRRQNITLENQRLALETSINLLGGQKQTITSILEVLHPIFPLEIYATFSINIDSLDNESINRINELQKYLTLPTSEIPKNLYILNKRDGIFWHDWHCIGSVLSEETQFNKLNFNFNETIVPDLTINLHRNKTDFITLYRTPIDWQDSTWISTRWYIDKIEGKVYVDLKIKQSKLIELGPGMNIIKSLYSCESGFIECSYNKHFANLYKGAYLRELDFSSGNYDEFHVFSNPEKYSKSGINKIYLASLRAILKNE